MGVYGLAVDALATTREQYRHAGSQAHLLLVVGVAQTLFCPGW